MKQDKLALIVLLLAAFFFSLSGVFNRMIGEEAGAFTGLTARTIIPALLFGFTVVVTKQKIHFKEFSKNDVRLFGVRSILTLVDFLTFFYAINKMELGITLLIFYISYLFTSFLYSATNPKEKTKFIDVLALMIAVIGLGIVYKFDFDKVKILPFIAACVSGAFYGLSSALSKFLTNKYSVITTNFITYTIIGLASIPIFFIAFFLHIEKFNTPFSVTGILGIIFIGINTFITFYLTLYGYKLINVNRASLILLSEIVFTFIVGYIGYHEKIFINTIIGTSMVMIALALPFVTKDNK